MSFTGYKTNQGLPEASTGGSFQSRDHSQLFRDPIRARPTPPTVRSIAVELPALRELLSEANKRISGVSVRLLELEQVAAQQAVEHDRVIEERNELQRRIAQLEARIAEAK